MEGSTRKTPYRIYVRVGEFDAEPDDMPEVLDDLALVGEAEGYDRQRAVDSLLDAALARAERVAGTEGAELDPVELRALKFAQKVEAGQRVVFQAASIQGIGEVPVQIEKRRKFA